MKRPVFLLPLYFVCLCLSVSLGVAQDQSQNMQVRFLTFEKVSGVSKDLKVRYAEEQSGPDIAQRMNNITGPYKVSQRLFQLVDGDRVISDIKVPPALGNQVLVILVPSRKKEAPFFAMPISDNAASFGPGDRKMINLTRKSIGGRVGEASFKVEPGKTEFFKAAKPGSDPRLPAEFFTKEGETWKIFTSTYWTQSSKRKSLVFFYQPPGRKTVRIKVIDEFIEAG